MGNHAKTNDLDLEFTQRDGLFVYNHFPLCASASHLRDNTPCNYIIQTKEQCIEEQDAQHGLQPAHEHGRWPISVQSAAKAERAR